MKEEKKEEGLKVDPLLKGKVHELVELGFSEAEALGALLVVFHFVRCCSFHVLFFDFRPFRANNRCKMLQICFFPNQVRPLPLVVFDSLMKRPFFLETAIESYGNYIKTQRSMEKKPLTSSQGSRFVVSFRILLIE